MDGLCHDVGNPPARIERGVWVLEDHLHARLHALAILDSLNGADLHALVFNGTRRGLIQPNN